MGVVNVVIAGLGGQGVVKASDILAAAAVHAGREVKKAEVHGMSQRGGSVTTDVRFGDEVLSPMVPPGEADYLVALAASEVAVNAGALRPAGVLLGPDLLDVAQLPNRRSFNVAMMGALSVHLDLPRDSWDAALAASLPPALLELNRKAFEAGRAAGLLARSAG
jgi:indolepyruvate ferredoxin oxidoreductase, beta subunit